MFVTANIFQPLISVFEAVLKFFHNNVGVGWGVSIVLLTILVRMLLFPLALRQFHSMRRMQQHMPELKAIQTKYKEDKQRQQQEMMTFYRENKINPFASCLPLVAQIPVFISLFYMLRSDLRKNICPQVQPGAKFIHGHWVFQSGAHTQACGTHAPGAGFLFIHDLTNKATGVTLVVLILLYVGTQFGSSLVMMSMSPQQDKMQRNLMLFLPLVFVFIIIGFPAGVLVYWITTNGWTILQQFLIGRRVPRLPAVAPAASGGGGGPGASGGGRGGGPRGGGGGNGGPPGGANGEGGLGGLLGRLKPAEQKPEATPAGARGGRGGPPPPSPRKKKKRSGRRR